VEQPCKCPPKLRYKTKSIEMKTNTTIFVQLHDLLHRSFIQLLEYSKVT
jgi:hypothetical protein